MEPQDALVVRIRREVSRLVPPVLVEKTVVAVVLAVNVVMNDPAFFNQLANVQALYEHIHRVQQENTILREALSGRVVPGKKAAPRKAAPKKRAAPRVTGGTAKQRAAFRQGYRS